MQNKSRLTVVLKDLSKVKVNHFLYIVYVYVCVFVCSCRMFWPSLLPFFCMLCVRFSLHFRFRPTGGHLDGRFVLSKNNQLLTVTLFFQILKTNPGVHQRRWAEFTSLISYATWFRLVYDTLTLYCILEKLCQFALGGSASLRLCYRGIPFQMYFQGYERSRKRAKGNIQKVNYFKGRVWGVLWRLCSTWQAFF